MDNSQCFTCLAQNEDLVGLRMNLTNQTSNGQYYSYCDLQGQFSCCLFSNDSTPLDSSDICLFGYCSNQIVSFNKNQQFTQYLYCNITDSINYNDSICGEPTIQLKQVHAPDKALKIYYDKGNLNPNCNDTTNCTTTNNQTNCTQYNNCTNQTNCTYYNNCTSNETNNQTNCTYYNNCTSNETNNQTNCTYYNNCTNNETNNQTNCSYYNNCTNNTNNNQTTNCTDYGNCTDNSTTGNDTSGNDTSGNSTTNQTTNDSSNSNSTTNDTSSSNSTDNSTDQNTTTNNSTNDTSTNTTTDTDSTIDPSQDNSTTNYTDQTVQTIQDNVNNTNPSVSQSNPIKICQYRVQYLDSLNQNGKYKLKLTSNGYQQIAYFIDRDDREIKQLTNESSLFSIDSDEELSMITILDLSQTVALYIEYELDLIETSDEEGLSVGILVAIIVSSVAGFLLIALVAYLIYRICTKKKNIIKLSSETQLQKESQNVQAMDQEKAQEFEKTKQMPKLSSLLFNNEVMQKLEKSQSKDDLTEQKGYNLTVEDINKKSQTSKSLNTQQDGVRHPRSKSGDLRSSALLKSGSLPRFDGHGHHMKDADDMISSGDDPIKLGEYDNNSEQTELAKFAMQKRSQTMRSSTKSGSGGQKTIAGATRIVTDDDDNLEQNMIDNEEDSQKRIIEDDAQPQGEDNPINKFSSEEDGENTVKRIRPHTAKPRNDEDILFKKRDHGQLSRQRTNRTNQNNSINIDRSHDQGNRKRSLFKKGLTSDVNELHDHHSHQDGADSPSNNIHTQNNDASDIDKNELFKKKLQIFQSESKFEDYEYMQYEEEGGDQEDIRNQINDNDDDIKSGFHSELREQFKQTKIHKGILKNNNDNQKNQKVSKKEEYQRRYDDYYQDANNIYFHTGTFNGDSYDDNESSMTIPFHKQ